MCIKVVYRRHLDALPQSEGFKYPIKVCGPCSPLVPGWRYRWPRLRPGEKVGHKILRSTPGLPCFQLFLQLRDFRVGFFFGLENLRKVGMVVV